jgi:D-alanyl-D-alanine carboxypeptidase
MVRLVLLALIACQSRSASTSVGSGSGPGITTTPVDAAVHQSLPVFLEELRTETKLPALAAAVWRNGRLIEKAVVGLRKLGDTAHPVTTDDRWHIGSNTKAMTATLVGIYVDRGTLRWDDTIAKLFAGEKIHPRYAKVTVDQLLRHRGGVPAHPPDPVWEALAIAGAAPNAREVAVRAILAAEPAHPVDTFEYSNVGYMIVGTALERATKKRWQDLMRDDLFTPLGMTSCGFGAPGTDAVDQPWGHDDKGTPIPPGPMADNPPGLGPAGTVHCSLTDYGKFLEVHLGGSPILKAESLAHLHDAQGTEYAGGWLVMTGKSGDRNLIHSGSNTMWMLTALVSPKTKLAFVLATNQANDSLEMLLLSKLIPRYSGE